MRPRRRASRRAVLDGAADAEDEIPKASSTAETVVATQSGIKKLAESRQVLSERDVGLDNGVEEMGGEEADDGQQEDGQEQGDDEQHEEDDEEEYDEDEEFAAEPKILPSRTSRGRRMQTLIGEAADQDDQFWGHDTWAEEREDEEWSTEDEAHYKDYVDSDFDVTESENEEGEETMEQKVIDLEEAAEKAKQRLSKAYRDPRMFPKGQVARARSIQPARPAVHKPSAQRPQPPPPALPRAELEAGSKPSKKGKAEKRRRVLSQEDHLAIAVRTELENTKRLNAMLDHENWKKAVREHKQTSSVWQGRMELMITWSSDRLMATEEAHLAQNPEACTPPETYCREMLFFIDFETPPNSSIPPMYTDRVPHKGRRRCCIFPDRFAKYRDPLTGEYYSCLEAFRVLHARLQRNTTAHALSRFRPLDAKLANLLHYLSLHGMLPFGPPGALPATSEVVHVVADQPPAMVQGAQGFVTSDIGAVAPALDDMYPVPSPASSPECRAGDRKGKRPRQSLDLVLPPPKKQKKKSVMQSPVAVAGEGGPAAAVELERAGRRPSRRTDKRRSHQTVPRAARESQPAVAPAGEPAGPMTSPLQHFQQPGFPIGRQPLRIRSTTNAFSQPPGFGIPSMFGDAYAPSPFNPCMMLPGRGVPFPSASSGMAPGIDPLTLYSMAAGFPYGIPPEAAFSPFMTTDGSHPLGGTMGHPLGGPLGQDPYFSFSGQNPFHYGAPSFSTPGAMPAGGFLNSSSCLFPQQSGSPANWQSPPDSEMTQSTSHISSMIGGHVAGGSHSLSTPSNLLVSAPQTTSMLQQSQQGSSRPEQLWYQSSSPSLNMGTAPQVNTHHGGGPADSSVHSYQSESPWPSGLSPHRQQTHAAGVVIRPAAAPRE